MDLSIIILSYNTKKILGDSLRSIYQNTGDLKFEIIVVDNDSSDGSADYVKKNFPKIILIENKINNGFSKGNNQGIKKSSGRYILFLNSDTIVRDNALSKLVKYMDEHPEIGGIGPKLLNSDFSPQASAGLFPSLPTVMAMLFFEHFGGSKLVRTSYEDIKEVDWVMGAALMIRKNILKKTGVFDENIFMYYDEVEWCYRIKNAGFKILYYPEAQIVHLWQKSSQSGKEGPIIANFKGLMYFYRKHKTQKEQLFLRFLLKLKAAISIMVGYMTNNLYLKETYGKAIKMV